MLSCMAKCTLKLKAKTIKAQQVKWVMTTLFQKSEKIFFQVLTPVGIMRKRSSGTMVHTCGTNLFVSLEKVARPSSNLYSLSSDINTTISLTGNV